MLYLKPGTSNPVPQLCGVELIISHVLTFSLSALGTLEWYIPVSLSGYHSTILSLRISALSILELNTNALPSIFPKVKH